MSLSGTEQIDSSFDPCGLFQVSWWLCLVWFVLTYMCNDAVSMRSAWEVGCLLVFDLFRYNFLHIFNILFDLHRGDG